MVQGYPTHDQYISILSKYRDQCILGEKSEKQFPTLLVDRGQSFSEAVANGVKNIPTKLEFIIFLIKTNLTLS